MHARRDLLRAAKVAVAAATSAGMLQLREAGEWRRARLKGERELVTRVDHTAEREITQRIREIFPSHAVLAEEGTSGGSDAAHLWIIDPLDGTTNFAHRIPISCVSIAYQREGKTEVGVVHDPHRGETFMAIRGQGATCNRVPIRVSTLRTMSEGAIGTGVPYQQAHMALGIAQLERVAAAAMAVRVLGSAALEAAYVACGRLDGYWEHWGVWPWDLAAGALLIEEAGGRTTSLDGSVLRLDGGEIGASNGYLHEQLLATIAGTPPEPIHAGLGAVSGGSMGPAAR